MEAKKRSFKKENIINCPVLLRIQLLIGREKWSLDLGSWRLLIQHEITRFDWVKGRMGMKEVKIVSIILWQEMLVVEHSDRMVARENKTRLYYSLY